MCCRKRARIVNVEQVKLQVRGYGIIIHLFNIRDIGAHMANL